MNKNTESILRLLEVDFGSLQYLQMLGLIFPNSMGQTQQNLGKNNIGLNYFAKDLIYEPTHESNFEFNLMGYYQLSLTGEQIIKHLNPKFLEEYFVWLKENFKIPNYKLIN